MYKNREGKRDSSAEGEGKWGLSEERRKSKWHRKTTGKVKVTRMTKIF